MLEESKIINTICNGILLYKNVSSQTRQQMKNTKSVSRAFNEF